MRIFLESYIYMCKLVYVLVLIEIIERENNYSAIIGKNQFIPL